MISCGFVLPPDEPSLEILAAFIEETPEHYEVSPETLWRRSDDGAMNPNGFHRRFLALKQRTRRPFIGRGVGYGLCDADERQGNRRRRWREALRRDHGHFDFQWYSDHLGNSVAHEQDLGLPLPVPMIEEATRATRQRLRELQTIVPAVGFENTAQYMVFGQAEGEPKFFRSILRTDFHLVLDLHNVHTTASNLGIDPHAYLDALPLETVIEIHISGGSESRPHWLASGRIFTLDGHDDVVPERVWELLDHLQGKCRNLRGLTLERMEGTIRDDDVPLLREELSRMRRWATRT